MEINGQKYLPFEQKHLDDWLRKKAYDELGEDEKTRNICLKELRAMIKDMKEDIYVPNDDTYLLQFLRYRKFNTTDAFKTIEKCSKFKKRYPEVFHTCKPSVIREVFSTHSVTNLPYRDKDGCMIRVTHTGKWNVEKLSVMDYFHSCMELLISLASDEVTQVCGAKFIYDLSGMTPTKLRQITFGLLKIMAQSFSNYFPARVKAIHFCNEPVIFSYFWAIISRLVSRKIRNRIYFHSSDMKSLHKYFDPAILPEELGGKLKYDDSCMERIEKILREDYEEHIAAGYRS